VGVITLFILGIMSAVWTVRGIIYGHQDTIFGEIGYRLGLDRHLPTIIGGIIVVVMFICLARKRFQSFKRGFDLLGVGLGLILASPLLLIVTILIKIDSTGSIFFKQERVGKDEKIFNMWKFRTMRNNAELETGAVWAAEEDPRITRLGRFLRKCHIDELPQFINVFKGEMSLIGPRPERPVFVDKINGYIPNYNERLKVRPGITGLAQVRYRYGASIRDAQRKLRYDLLYIKEMCWMLDVRIMLWTVGRVLTGVGAR